MAGIDARHGHVLDIGSGLGGPAFELARGYTAHVTGIDLEAHLVKRARRRAGELGLDERVQFTHVEPGPLPFEDASFDVVFSSGALTQTQDKAGLLAECWRVLKPGGWLTLYDWLKSEGPLSDDMLYFFEMEGLTYNMVTLEEMAAIVEGGGFSQVTSEDATEWYRRQARKEYDLMRGDGFDRVVNLIGKADADHLVEDWRSMVVVIDKGELRQGYTKARKALSGPWESGHAS